MKFTHVLSVVILLLGLSSAEAQDQPKAQRYPPLPINKGKPAGKAPDGMVLIPGGWFWMGTDDVNHPESGPVHKVYVDAVWMDETEITNVMWAKFVGETGYKTVAERKPHPSLFPNVPPENLKGIAPFSLVFTPPAMPVRNLTEHLQWWKAGKGANWQHPLGPKSDIKKKANHPVVHICWLDAVLYCNWRSHKAKLQPCYDLFKGKAKRRLTVFDACKLSDDDFFALKISVPTNVLKRTGYRPPTEAEWEFAARGGMNQKKYTWGDKLTPKGKHMANIWQGKFPNQNTRKDGFYRTAPVKSFPPNGYGLYDMAGNVWEWCQDWYHPEYYKFPPAKNPKKNPPGPANAFQPKPPGELKRVQRGGSFLCHESYCVRYLTYARGKGEFSSASDPTGFRCVRSAILKKQ